jgi:glycoprotein endo-alpha-1,2-mannosidase
VLPHWDPKIQARFEHLADRVLYPPEELHSSFRPLDGPYSVRDPAIIESTLARAEQAGIDVLALSWWGRPSVANTGDSQGVNTDNRLFDFVAVADRSDRAVRIAFHLEPYPGRTVESVSEDVKYLEHKFRSSRSVFKDSEGRLLYFVYDSYHIRASDWARLLRPEGDLYFPKGKFVGLWLDQSGGRDLVQAGFQGAYTYFASPVGYGSQTHNWATMAQFLQSNGLEFYPSVGPGYNDVLIRPWNTGQTRARDGHAYFDNMFESAIRSGAAYVSICSWNEWGEGTQIEPASDYPQGDPFLYLSRSKFWKEQCRQARVKADKQDEL